MAARSFLPIDGAWAVESVRAGLHLSALKPRPGPLQVDRVDGVDFVLCVVLQAGVFDADYRRSGGLRLRVAWSSRAASRADCALALVDGDLQRHAIHLKGN